MYFHTYNQTENTRFSQKTMTLFGGIYNPYFGWATFLGLILFWVECLRYCQNIISGYSELQIPTCPKFTDHSVILLYRSMPGTVSGTISVGKTITSIRPNMPIGDAHPINNNKRRTQIVLKTVCIGYILE